MRFNRIVPSALAMSVCTVLLVLLATAQGAHAQNCVNNSNCTGVGQYCNNGTCACEPYLTLCGTTCVDLLHNTSNCGSCGNVAPTGTVCTDGVVQRTTCY